MMCHICINKSSRCVFTDLAPTSFQGSRLGRESSKNRAADVYWEQLQTEAGFQGQVSTYFPPTTATAVVEQAKTREMFLTGFEKNTGGVAWFRLVEA